MGASSFSCTAPLCTLHSHALNMQYIGLILINKRKSSKISSRAVCVPLYLCSVCSFRAPISQAHLSRNTRHSGFRIQHSRLVMTLDWFLHTHLRDLRHAQVQVPRLRSGHDSPVSDVRDRRLSLSLSHHRQLTDKAVDTHATADHAHRAHRMAHRRQPTLPT